MGAAPVGIEGSTSTPTEYTHPEKNAIKLWDLPGIGTPENHDLETYCNSIGKLEKYDAFLVFSKSRFTNRESDLAEKISKKSGKPFVFVCTYVDGDVKNIMKDEGKDEIAYDEQTNKKRRTEILTKIRRDCLKNLKGLVKNETDLYLIDTRFKENYDFSRLHDDVFEKLLQGRLMLFLRSFNEQFYENCRLKLDTTQKKYEPDVIYEVVIESWQNVQINFAITGDSGAGKSSFINAVRG